MGARENHDASAFYGRFRPPELSTETDVPPPAPVANPFVHGDSRSMDQVADGSVALVVTSPPYFAGKQYEEELDREGVPSSYLEYLGLLTDVFAECARKLEPGGRIAVNVANLGRRPYRSLSADVIRILEHDLGLLLRGELVWQKGEGASGSCAWGSFRSAANPVLRDLTERVIVASKGRFDRAQTTKARAAKGLPHRSTLGADDFMALTLDLWEIPPESARRVGHPAPFPVELPEQLISLYTFEDDLVLDPFMGSGSTLVAAAMLGRRYVGYDLDPSYVALAEQRVADALAATAPGPTRGGDRVGDGQVDGGQVDDSQVDDSQVDDRQVDDRQVDGGLIDGGLSARKLAEAAVTEAGFTIERTNRPLAGTAVAVSIVATDARGSSWYFDVAGPHTRRRGGLARAEQVWRTIGRAAAVRGRDPAAPPFVVLTTELPRRRTDGDTALRAAGPGLLFDVVDLRSHDARARLAAYAAAPGSPDPLAGFWTTGDLDGRHT
ncbi:MAG TPA: site-specific DNA-methyltransferase [Acidimicrobiales bacterium]|nr:site-specific DNA-methyltransferase [Acidimicrobiales bacterium]